MRKLLKAFGLAAGLTITMSVTAFAGQWREDADGWWWQEDDGSYAVSSWQWLDGNQDGVAECYYFDGNGYMAANTTVDGYQVNGDGCWVVGGRVMTHQSGQAARDTLQAVLAQSEGQTNMDVGLQMNMQMSAQGTTIDVGMTGDMKIQNADSAQMQYIMDMNMNMLGMDIPVTTFYTDGYMYMDMYGQKLKMPMDYQEALEAAQSMQMSYGDDMSYIQDVSVVDNEDGTRTIYYAMDGAQMTSMVQMSQNLMGTTGAVANTADTSISLCKAEVTLDGAGTILQQRVLMDMSVAVEGTPVDYTIFMEMNTKNPGQTVSFTLPSTEGYEELIGGATGNLS